MVASTTSWNLVVEFLFNALGKGVGTVNVVVDTALTDSQGALDGRTRQIAEPLLNLLELGAVDCFCRDQCRLATR